MSKVSIRSRFEVHGTVPLLCNQQETVEESVVNCTFAKLSTAFDPEKFQMVNAGRRNTRSLANNEISLWVADQSAKPSPILGE
ncbi:hypothetical protein QJS10_CPA10g01589 [Acorus calamus]|uniref:Uncharacterized protein n=1 Tax=Acorus calamus TaxID=4465 RepID=A0AAV9E2V4_ACOCL|nr:hypothetical protein QJS10_CPA10g01589 [Acorus calamus]